MDTGKINMLLSELGEVLNLERVTAYDDQMWSLHFAENNSVDVLLVEEKGELLISKSLHIEQEDITLDKLQVLLEYNFLYRETGGVQFCVNPTTKDVVLQVAIAAESELTNIANLMIQLNELVETWAQLFQNNTVVDFSQTDVHAFIQV
ncbi:type III secretion system chaperone [Vibrio diabolicus]|uniref:type III secretion system chaperone n=1 Tax=Vibrio diabolicus TaxID=50719 RepID=UPI0021604D00|nr:type III secretion system chaperone [Vibrio diabolicus]MCS0309522.1 type III secretion system chaperone [Vibrio diabolicus]MCS0408946.1 type III secretion system chaperone [Vibrio diabolicus]